MIGYDTGGPNGGGWSPQPAADRLREMWHEREDAPVWGWVEEIIGRVVTVLETIEVLDPIRIERWETAGDERTCPECAPLHGRMWQAGDGPAPPLHVNCRCRRTYARTEWRRREVREWRRRTIPQRRLAWRITGWR